MRHRVEAAAPQPRTGGDDVVMRYTSRMVDEHGCAGIEQFAQGRREIDNIVCYGAQTL